MPASLKGANVSAHFTFHPNCLILWILTGCEYVFSWVARHPASQWAWGHLELLCLKTGWDSRLPTHATKCGGKNAAIQESATKPWNHVTALLHHDHAIFNWSITQKLLHNTHKVVCVKVKFWRERRWSCNCKVQHAFLSWPDNKWSCVETCQGEKANRKRERDERSNVINVSYRILYLFIPMHLLVSLSLQNDDWHMIDSNPTHLLAFANSSKACFTAPGCFSWPVISTIPATWGHRAQVLWMRLPQLPLSALISLQSSEMPQGHIKWWKRKHLKHRLSKRQNLALHEAHPLGEPQGWNMALLSKLEGTEPGSPRKNYPSCTIAANTRAIIRDFPRPLQPLP